MFKNLLPFAVQTTISPRRFARILLMLSRFFLRSILLVSFFALTLAARPALASESGGHGGGGEAAATEDSGPQFVKVGPINVPVIKDGRVAQYLMLVAALEVKDADAAKQIETRMPQIKDAYLSSLFGSLQLTAEGGDLVDVNMIRRKIEEANGRVLPSGLVSNVFLQQVEQRQR